MLLFFVAAVVPVGTEPPAQFKSPEAVFETWAKATAKEDFKTLVECVAVEARPEMAGAEAASTLALRGPRNEIILVQMRNRMMAVMAKHGLTARTTAHVRVPLDTAYGDAKSRVALGKLVKNPETFIVDMLTARKEPGRPARERPMVLSDLKIDGNKAIAVVTETQPFGAFKQSISFVRGTDGWRILPSYEPATLAPPNK